MSLLINILMQNSQLKFVNDCSKVSHYHIQKGLMFSIGASARAPQDEN